MLRILLAKDLRRARRNPLPWLINLIVPLVMTALIGLVFGGGDKSGALGRIRFAVVDEDRSVLSDMLEGAAGQRESNQYLEPVFMDRAAALREINANKISAVLIIRTNFLHDYLTASAPVSMQLIKNPAESIHPAVLEELLGALTTGLSELSRNFNSAFPGWQSVIAGKSDYHQVAALIESAGDKLQSVKNFINPPLVGYEKPEPEASHPKAATSTNIFAYLLIGLAAMFLLFLANNAMTDLHREIRLRTFERYQTMRQTLWPFIFGKFIFTVVILLICSAIMLGGGGLIFRIQWPRLPEMLALCFGYACFVAALFASLVAVVPDERRAGVLNTIVGMAFGLAGGCAFPPQQLPAFLREHISTQLPSYWFAETLRNLECGSGDAPWIFITIKLVGASLLFIGLATVLLHRRLQTGTKA